VFVDQDAGLGVAQQLRQRGLSFHAPKAEAPAAFPEAAATACDVIMLR
jgi:hypothetical protein